jgi:ubiquinone biosynthesis protein UbiJ
VNIPFGRRDPMLPTAALALLERAINQALRLDPASRQRLAALAGQVFHLHCTQPDIEVFVLPQADGVRLAAYHDAGVTAGLTGTGGDFAKLLGSDDPAAELINGNLSVRGDSKALQQLQAIAAGLDLDWEAPLARVFGDVVGHQLGRGLRHLADRALYAGRQIARQINDFAHHESGLLAGRAEVGRFGLDVEQVARRTEQFEARLRQLQQRVAAHR